ncbi:MAG TPA: ATP-dependent helicase, partial [Acholeplasma sp.]|nr:ATP-dependent helicase [Acholeplasma sp.]
MPPFIKKIAKNYQKSPITVKVEGTSLTVDKIDQNYYMVKEKDKKQLLIRLIDYLQPKSAIIFANTKKDVDEITEFLQKNKYSADGLHGDLKQTQRSYVMNNFRNNNTKFLVATDVAARGLDVENIELVINYDVPHELEIYVHRIGRTGRAGNKGEAYTFITPRKARFSSEIEKFTNSKLFLKQIPSKEDIESKQNYNFIKELKQKVNKNEGKNEDIIKELINDGFTERQILNSLLEDIKPSTNRYNKIDIIETKKNKNQGRSNNNMLTVAVNIGKKERLTPDVLLKLLRKEYNIDSRFIGNIKHLQDETKFEISDRDLKKINTNKKVIFKGKRIKFKMSK